MEEKEAKQLFRKYLAGQCTPEEKARLERWYLQHERVGLTSLTPMQLEEIYKARLPLSRGPVRRVWSGWAAAVLLLLLSGLSMFLFTADLPEGLAVSQLTIVQDSPPGGNRATIAFSDGRHIALDESQQGVRIEGGMLTYLDGSAIPDGNATTVRDITVTTPVGGQYQLVLSDGTIVRLNAETSITYPVTFTGTERRVVLRGEAFFDVTKQTDGAASVNPFLVETQGQVIRVLGTRFNVSAYPGHLAERTTLIEGVVDVLPNATSTSVRIAPGQQAVVSETGAATQEVNIDQVIAWTNGYFWFDNDPLSDVLDQLSKWYGVEFEYDSRLMGDKLYGMIDRSKYLSQVLHILESTEVVTFTISDQIIYVHAYKK